MTTTMDDDRQTTCEGMGPEEPPEVLEDPVNVAAADAIRAASIAGAHPLEHFTEEP